MLKPTAASPFPDEPRKDFNFLSFFKLAYHVFSLFRFSVMTSEEMPVVPAAESFAVGDKVTCFVVKVSGALRPWWPSLFHDSLLLPV